MKIMATPMGPLKLDRYPRQAPNSLQAWDAADELLLNVAAEYLSEHPNACIWIINDSFGALSTALAPYKPWMLSDSILAQKACVLNHQLNQKQFDPTHYLDSLHWPDQAADLVLFKVPKILSFFEYQLSELKQRLPPQTKVIGAVMCKQLQRSMVTLIERYLGPCQPSLASKKARLLPCNLDPELTAAAPPPSYDYEVPEYQLKLGNLPNLFCRDHLDIGTRFLLENLPQELQASRIVDLACGNGVIGIVAAQRAPSASVLFADESFMAIASAKANASLYLGDSRSQSFIVANGLEGIESASADLIFNNPPFHQQHVVGDFIARNLFKDAYRVLTPGGELWIVANRQLGYHKLLKTLFGNVEVIASNPKFVLLKAKR